MFLESHRQLAEPDRMPGSPRLWGEALEGLTMRGLRFIRLWLGLALALGLVMAAPGLVTARVRVPGPIVKIGTLFEGGDSVAYSINNRGDVVGYAQAPTYSDHAFLYSHGVLRDLGTATGDPRDMSYAAAINSAGMITGASQIAGGAEHAILYFQGRWTDLGTLGGPRSWGESLNDHGDVVGNSDTSTANTMHAFLWRQGKMMDLGTLGGQNSYAIGVSNGDLVAGTSDLGDGRQHGFIWQAGRMVDITSITGGRDAIIRSINSGGAIAGTVDGQAYLYDHGRVTLLGFLPGGTWSSASIISDSGAILANGDDANGDTQLFVWLRGQKTVIHVSGLPGADETFVTDMNSRGTMCGASGTGGMSAVYWSAR
jgi:probable HAF family extracellular repeat protein